MADGRAGPLLIDWYVTVRIPSQMPRYADGYVPSPGNTVDHVRWILVCWPSTASVEHKVSRNTSYAKVYPPFTMCTQYLRCRPLPEASPIFNLQRRTNHVRTVLGRTSRPSSHSVLSSVPPAQMRTSGSGTLLQPKIPLGWLEMRLLSER